MVGIEHIRKEEFFPPENTWSFPFLANLWCSDCAQCGEICAWPTTGVGDDTEILREFSEILIPFCTLLFEIYM